MAKIEKLEKSRVKLTIEVSADAFDEATEKAYHKDAKHFNVPGFRKGKAPRKVIETMYGEGVFFETAFDLVYADAYEAAVNEFELEPVERPDVEILEVGKGQTLVFTATVAVRPEVELGVYKGMEVPVEESIVTDEMVDAQIERERAKLVRYVDLERAAELGDRVILDFSGSIDGVKFEGGTAEDQTLDLGSGSFIPGFEEQVVGLKAGESKDINVTFPEEYHAEELKGKPAVFSITLKAVHAKEFPALDDEFAKDVSEFDTLEELRAEKRRKLEENAASSNRIRKQNEAVRVATANATIDIPDAMVDREIAYMLKDISYRLSSQGLSFEEYLKYTGQDMENIRDQYREDALQRVRSQLTLAAIAKAEDIKADDGAVENAVKEYAEQLGQAPEELIKKLNAEDRAYFEDQIVTEKTVNLLVDNATFVAKKEEAPREAVVE